MGSDCRRSQAVTSKERGQAEVVHGEQKNPYEEGGTTLVGLGPERNR